MITAKGDEVLLKKILQAICIIVVIAAIVTGITYIKMSAHKGNSLKVLPAVDTLVIEGGNMLVYNGQGGALWKTINPANI